MAFNSSINKYVPTISPLNMAITSKLFFDIIKGGD